MAFDDARAPREDEAGGDGLQIEAQALGEAEDESGSVSLGLAHPGQPLITLAVLEEVVEGAGQVAGSGDAGAGQADVQELFLLVRRRVSRGSMHDAELYKDRNTVERLINRLKAWRGIATRFDKTPESHQAGLHFRASVIWIKDLARTAH